MLNVSLPIINFLSYIFKLKWHFHNAPPPLLDVAQWHTIIVIQNTIQILPHSTKKHFFSLPCATHENLNKKKCITILLNVTKYWLFYVNSYWEIFCLEWLLTVSRQNLAKWAKYLKLLTAVNEKLMTFFIVYKNNADFFNFI